MFMNTSHLPQILLAEDYTSAEQHEREISRLFQPAWHYVGSLADIPNDGDYLTTELFGEPLIVWNRDGGVHAFLNVCPHRFSTLSEQPCGQAAPHLKCQYHGWEFDATGNTRRIPDARCFKPMKQGTLGLVKYRAERCGQLIFVALEEAGPSLSEFLREGYEVGRQLFSERRRGVLDLDYIVECNWKVKIENTLESYHIEMVHPTTFKFIPPAEICFHELEPGWTSFYATEDAPTRVKQLLERWIHRIAGLEIDKEYKHWIFYPHIMYGKMRAMTWVETVYPISPHRCRIVLKVFVDPGTAGRFRRGLTYRGWRIFARRWGTRTSGEDASVMPAIQRGLKSRRKPSDGLLSIREERLFHFQNYVRQATRREAPRPDEMKRPKTRDVLVSGER